MISDKKDSRAAAQSEKQAAKEAKRREKVSFEIQALILGIMHRRKSSKTTTRCTKSTQNA